MCCNTDKQNKKPSYEIQDIFNLYADDYVTNHRLTSEQKRAIRDISNCRTSKLGFNARECNGCNS